MAGAHEVGLVTCSYCVECDDSWVPKLCVVSGIIGKFYDTVPRTSLNKSPENNLEVRYSLRNQGKTIMSPLNEDFILIRKNNLQ
jgi:hypothetical protein